MQEFKYYMRLYKLFCTQYIKVKIQYRADTLVSSIAMILVSIAGIFTYRIVFNSINKLGGLSYFDVMVMYSLYLIIISPAGILLNNLWNLKTHLLEGTFVKYLLRPINPLFYYVSEVFDIRGIVNLLIGIVCFCYSITKIEVNWSASFVISLIIMIISGSCIVCAMMLLGASTAFFIMNSHFVNMFINKIIDFAKYPLSIYNKALQLLFTFVLPIGFAAFYPTNFILNMKTFNIVNVLAPIIAVLFLVLSYLLWENGIKRYSGTGS